MATRIGPVAPQLLPVLLVRIIVPELLSGRTAIDILIAEIDEVLLAEAALCLNAGCHRFWKRNGDAGVVAGHDLLAVEVAAIGNGFELIDRQLCPVLATSQFVRYDQVMLVFHRHLHVVTNHTRATPARCHQRDLLIRGG